jgi:glycosyltransferase involved in cell wall biosynthesis
MSSKNQRILIISANGDDPTTGYATRVLQVAATLKAAGNDVKLVRFYPFHHPRSWKTTTEDTGIALLEIPMPPMSRFFIARWATVVLANIITYLLAKIWRAGALQAESHDAALIALWIKWLPIPVMVDVHGAAPEEAEFLDRQTKTCKSRRWLHYAEQLIVTKSHTHFVVSNQMVQHLAAKHRGVCSQAKILPIGVNLDYFPKLDTYKQKINLGIDPSKRVIAYCGGDQKYQCLEEMASFLKLVSGFLNLHVLVISKSTAAFERAFEPIKCTKTFVSADHQSVHQYLNAADYGLLIRRDELLNRVSCPTKFAEYLACGLAVITTPWAGHGPDIVAQYHAGLVINPLQIETDELKYFFTRKFDRKYLRSIAVENLDWKRASQTLTESFETLGNIPTESQPFSTRNPI